MPRTEPTTGEGPPRPSSTAAPQDASVAAQGNPVKRLVLAGAGIVFVALGGLGVVVPGLPTTVFLILAGYCFTRSIPALERKLIRNKWFAPYLRYVDGSEEMPIGARVRALFVMWLSILLSCIFLIYRDIHFAVPLAVLAAGAVGTWYIWARAGRTRKPEPPDR